jgi:hypothetical protein
MMRGRALSTEDAFRGKLVVVLAFAALLIAAVIPLGASLAWASACTSPLVTACSIGSNLVLNSADITFSTFGSGHQSTLTFLADGFTFNTIVPLSGPGSGAATYSISTLNGRATIEDLSASLINDRLTDSVTFTSPGGNLVLDSNTPSGEKLFAPVSSLSGSITVVLGPGETLGGLTLRFSQIPEPSALLLLGSGFAALACVALRRHRGE